MKSCRDVDVIMTAYVDGEAVSAAAAAVDAHLAECPDCRDRADRERTMREVLRAKATTLGERASPGLRARCVAAIPERVAQEPAAVVTGGATGGRHRGWLAWAPVSAAATVLLAVGAVFIVGQNARLQAAFAAQLAKDHDKCFVHPVALDPAFDTARAEAILAREFGIVQSVPGETDTFNVIDVRQCEYDGGGMAHVLCEWNGQPVSLFVVPGRSGPERRLETIGHDAMLWSRDDMGFALVAEQGVVEIGQVARYVRGATD